MCIQDWVVVFCAYFTAPTAPILKHWHTSFSPLYLCGRGLHSFSFFPNFSHAHAFNFYRGVEFTLKAQLAAAQLWFWENACSTLVAHWIQTVALQSVRDPGLCYLHKQISFSAVSNAVRYFHSNSQRANLSANKSTHTVGITKQGGALVSGPNNCFIEIFDKQELGVVQFQ